MTKSDASQRGSRGESVAARYLEQRGWCICCRNYHSIYGEIDLIAQNQEFLAFVEVKTRRPNGLYSAAEAVTAAKQSKIIKTAQQYLLEHPTDRQPRFDVCEVYGECIGEKTHWRLRFFEDAFQVPSNG